MSKKYFFRSPKNFFWKKIENFFFSKNVFFFEMTSWRFHTIPDRSQPLHIAKSDYQDSEILGFWSEIDDMVLALLRATMTSGGCARQFWHGQGCPEVIRYRELEKSWRLSERKPREWCDFRVEIRVLERVLEIRVYSRLCYSSDGSRIRALQRKPAFGRDYYCPKGLLCRGPRNRCASCVVRVCRLSVRQIWEGNGHLPRFCHANVAKTILWTVVGTSSGTWIWNFQR